MKILSALALFIFLISCQNNTSAPGLSAADSQKTVEQLRNEVLEAACNEEIRSEYETEINSRQNTLTEAQLKILLVQMKNNIRC